MRRPKPIARASRESLSSLLERGSMSLC
jgi:hypothetical protein